MIVHWHWFAEMTLNEKRRPPVTDASYKGYRRGIFLVCGTLFLWSIAWSIYGGILLYGSNGKICKNSLVSSGKNLYRSVLAYWILMLIGMPLVALCAGLSTWEYIEK